MDCGFNREKPRASLEKEPGRTGMLGSRPLDRDLAAQDGSGLDLIWHVDPRSSGQGERGAGGGAGSAGGEPSGGGLPEFVEIDAPGVKSSRELAWDGQGDTCKPPGPRMGHGVL